MKKIFVLVYILLFLFVFNTVIFASESPGSSAAAYIILEEQTGRILSESNAHTRIFPAATTMILTAIMAYENIPLDYIVVVGNEIDFLPAASGRNFHQIGESITVENLIRSMIIGQGNDAANTVAVEIARRNSKNELNFNQSMQLFLQMMNDRARELGAYNSNFMNPHGYHHGNHFSTAYDMAMIARHALSISILRQIFATAFFSGPMAEGSVTRTWNSPNELIRQGFDGYYPYAIGLRTGFTNLAGQSLVAAAAQNEITLISAIFNAPVINDVPTRFSDAISLFEWGFQTFSFREFSNNDIAGEIEIYDPILGEENMLEFYADFLHNFFLSDDEYHRIETTIHFASEYVNEDGYILAPINEGQVIGEISYELDGEVLFLSPIMATRQINERTTATDIDYYMAWFLDTFFSRTSIPYWIAALSVLILLTVLIIMLRNKIKKKKNAYRYKMNAK